MEPNSSNIYVIYYVTPLRKKKTNVKITDMIVLNEFIFFIVLTTKHYNNNTLGQHETANRIGTVILKQSDWHFSALHSFIPQTGISHVQMFVA